MIFIQDSQTQYITHPAIGEKAKELFKLRQFDVNIPRWVVLPADFMAEAFKNLTSLSNTGDLLRAIDQYVFPASVEAELRLLFPDDLHLAVRPSPWIDPGHEDAFDEQYASFMMVPRTQVLHKIKAVWRSIFSDEVLAYRATHRLSPNLGIAVIIQEVVHAKSSGVAYAIHPTRGSRKEKFISGIFGLGGTAGNVEADTYTMTAGGIDRQIARKREQLVVRQDGEVVTEEVLRIHQHDQAVADEHLLTISKLLDDLRTQNQQFYQLQFALQDDKIQVIQAQPIWRLDQLPDTSGEYNLWDNSNFADEFSGVITPLTYSCVKTYSEADQKIRAAFFGASKAVMKRYKDLFSNAVGLIHGRLYSNLRVQQTLDAMLPENRVGVHFLHKNQHSEYHFDTADVYPGSVNEAWWNMVLLTGKLYNRYRKLSQKGVEFRKYAAKILRKYQNLDWQTKDPHELMQLYLQLERTLLLEWDTPFQADFFYQVHFGWLQQQTRPFTINGRRDLATDLLMDTKSLATIQPLQRRIEIAQKIQASGFLKTLFVTESEKQVWHFILHDNRYETVSLKNVIQDYLQDIDDYCAMSQKAEENQKENEAISFIATLQSYLQRHINDLDHARQVESEIRSTAEENMKQNLRQSPFKRWWYHRTLHNSRELLKMKEEFQYDYKRLWNVVGRLFSTIGSRFSEEGILEFESDIHFLSKEEIFAFIDGRSITTDLNALVGLRKEEYERFQVMPASAVQLATYGIPYHSNDFTAAATNPVRSEVKMQGLISCSGKSQGVVRVWTGDDSFVLADGEIIIARCADARIDAKLVSASALLIERGSVWNPLCVLARQMNLPTIVEIEDLLSNFKDGDLVEVDAVVGEIRKVVL
ncbi:PEP/pyruvate-binding domain-containing protein [Sphingobacterium chungjuense]|uniref:PEP/pyruvate-binding domain-containing protein n=1 Tax=Sphingobacterium chungjuense TaxID=2675553 RepID=UPI00140D058B|nr:PEP/pyruvate-binding domain-containing protein [Sphingobacterium chungjuense]